MLRSEFVWGYQGGNNSYYIDIAKPVYQYTRDQNHRKNSNYVRYALSHYYRECVRAVADAFIAMAETKGYDDREIEAVFGIFMEKRAKNEEARKLEQMQMHYAAEMQAMKQQMAPAAGTDRAGSEDAGDTLKCADVQRKFLRPPTKESTLLLQNFPESIFLLHTGTQTHGSGIHRNITRTVPVPQKKKKIEPITHHGFVPEIR